MRLYGSAQEPRGPGRLVASTRLQLLCCALAHFHGRSLLASAAAGSSAQVPCRTSSESCDTAWAASSAPPIADRHCWKRPVTVSGIGAHGLKTCAQPHLLMFSSSAIHIPLSLGYKELHLGFL